MRMFEVNPDSYGAKLEDIAQYLFENCKPYLREIDYQPVFFPLYRGMKYDSEDFTVKDVRLDDRRAQDMDSAVHSQLNSYFQNKFGEPFRNALFVAGTQHVAESFGKLYMVFPIGEFSFIWSPQVFDLYSQYGENMVDDLEEKRIQEFIEMMDSLQYQNTDLKQAIKHTGEIMIRCSEYAAVRVKGSDDKFEFEAKLQAAIKKVSSGYKR